MHHVLFIQAFNCPIVDGAPSNASSSSLSVEPVRQNQGCGMEGSTKELAAVDTEFARVTRLARESELSLHFFSVQRLIALARSFIMPVRQLQIDKLIN